MSIITYTSILIIAFRSGIAFVGVTPDNHLELIQQHDLDFRPISIAMGEVSHLKVGESPSYLVALEKAVVVSNGRGGSVEIVVEDSDTGVWARQESLSLNRPGQMLRIDPQLLRK